MIINIMYVHVECCINQMNIKLWSLNEEKGNFEYQSWRHTMFRGPKKKGVLQLGEYSIYIDLVAQEGSTLSSLI